MPSSPSRSFAAAALKGSGLLFFLVAGVGQILFVWFIAAYYGTRTFTANFAAWNDKPIIMGHVEGDAVGNAMFAAHVLVAAVMTAGGLLQLVPAIRARFPAFHRWNGRVFIATACFLAAGGIWMGTVRGARLSWISASGTILDGILIFAFAGIALRFAIARRIDIHRRWAMRLFIVANGVWFFRVTLMAWVIVNGGPRLMNETMSGPADIAIAYGCYLLPLAGLELYLLAQAAKSPALKLGAAAVVVVGSCLMAAGVFGAFAFLWRPYV